MTAVTAQRLAMLHFCQKETGDLFVVVGKRGGPIAGVEMEERPVSPASFIAHPPDLQFWPLMDMDFATSCPLVRPALPHIRYLFVRLVERATREHGRAEDRRGPQRRAELIGPAPSNLVSPTIERLVDRHKGRAATRS